MLPEAQIGDEAEHLDSYSERSLMQATVRIPALAPRIASPPTVDAEVRKRNHGVRPPETIRTRLLRSILVVLSYRQVSRWKRGRGACGGVVNCSADHH